MPVRERENIDRPLQHYEDIYMREPAIGARPGRPGGASCQQPSGRAQSGTGQGTTSPLDEHASTWLCLGQGGNLVEM